MKKAYIEINGKSFPCYQTMGALMILERETGKNAQDCNTISDQVVFIWACCKSACRRENMEFPYTIEDFADNLTPDELATAVQAAQEPQKDDCEDDGSKKV